MLSREAVDALISLEHGARMNCIHTVARELIEAGMAFDGWGKLEITEMGRRAARTLRSFTVDDPNIANLHEHGAADVWSTPVDSHPLAPDLQPSAAPSRDVPPTDAELDQAEDALRRAVTDPDAADAVDRNKPTLAPQVEAMGMAWSRSRAMQAAGVANGTVGIWVDERWVAAFLDAYERIE